MTCLSLLRQQLGGEKWKIRGRRKDHIHHTRGGGLVAKWCPTPCSPMDCSTLGSSVGFTQVTAQSHQSCKLGNDVARLCFRRVILEGC